VAEELSFTKAAARLHVVRAGLRGTLELGILHGLTPAHVPQSLAAFRADYPLVDIHLVAPGHGGTADHAESLLEGRLDLAYVLATGPLPDLQLHTLTTEDLVLACAADHPLADRSTIDLVDLLDSPFIDFPPGWGIRSAVDRSYAAAGLQHRRTTLEMNEITTVLDLVRHRLGISFVPESLCAQAPDLHFLRVRE